MLRLGPRGKLAAAVVTAIAIELAIASATTPQLMHRPQRFEIFNVANGSLIAQEFVAARADLARIDVDASVSGRGAGRLDVRLVRQTDEGDREVYAANGLTIAAGRRCCGIGVPVVHDPSDGRYRLELRLHDLDPGVRVDVAADSLVRDGGLVVNGRRVPANLAFRVDAGVRSLPGQPAIGVATVAAAFGVIDLSAFLVVIALVRA
jgi:hypothetical protein